MKPDIKQQAELIEKYGFQFPWGWNTLLLSPSGRGGQWTFNSLEDETRWQINDGRRWWINNFQFPWGWNKVNTTMNMWKWFWGLSIPLRMKQGFLDQMGIQWEQRLSIPLRMKQNTQRNQTPYSRTCLSIPLRMKHVYCHTWKVGLSITFNSLEDETLYMLQFLVSGGGLSIPLRMKLMATERPLLRASTFQFPWGWNCQNTLFLITRETSFNSLEDETIWRLGRRYRTHYHLSIPLRMKHSGHRSPGRRCSNLSIPLRMKLLLLENGRG